MDVCFLGCKDYEDLEICLNKKVVAFRRNYQHKKGTIFYLAGKKDKTWYICGRAILGDKVAAIPFKNPELYKYGYALENVEICEPFPINEKCKEVFGSFWGIYFQSTTPINNEEMLCWLEKKVRQ